MIEGKSDTGVASRPVKIDLENWMGQLPEAVTTMPLIHLAIPGSHNSFSYSISSDQGVSPDAPQVVQTLGKLFKPITRHFVLNWSRGQIKNVESQLRSGIRYYDVRLVLKDGEILIAHGLYGGPIVEFLEDINTFLQNHPKEVVILDFQHFYEFTARDHEKLLSTLRGIFEGKICYRRRRMKENTLRNCWDLKNQILIIYRHQVTSRNDALWPSVTWETPWHNKIKIRELIDCLDEGLATRNDGVGYVSQGILTPTPSYLIFHFFGSLRRLASRKNKNIVSWIESKNNGADGINVVICDFIENYNFCEKVILLNYKDQLKIISVNINQEENAHP